MAALALVGFALAGCGGSAAPVRSPSTTQAAGSAASPTTGLATGTTSTWSRATSPTLTVGGGATSTLSALQAPAQPGDDWLVAGTRTTAEGTSTATVWTSPDASTWTATALTGPGVDSTAAAVTVFGSRTVVVGSVGVGASRRAAVWVSARSGDPFVAVADQPAFAATASDANDDSASSPAPTALGAEMHVAGAGALGLFAAGTVDGHQAMWYSTDGRHFTRVAGAERLINGAPGADVRSILVTQAGVFAAGTRRSGVATDGTIWTSTDGLRWAQEPDAGQAFSGGGDYRISAITAMVRGTATIYEAVGAVNNNGTWAPASWISPDGFSWSAPSLSFPMEAARPDPDGAAVDAVSPTSGGLVAVGGGDGIALAWTSVDGRSWTPLGLPASATAAAWHPGLVATDGATTLIADPDAGVPRLLVGTGAVPPAATAATPVSWSEATGSAAVWGTPRAEAKPVSLVRAGGTLRLVVDVTQPGQLLGQDQASVVVLESSDGSSWSVVPTGSVFSGARVAQAIAWGAAGDTGTSTAGGGATVGGATVGGATVGGATVGGATVGGATVGGAVAVGAQAATTSLLAAGQPQGEAWRLASNPAASGPAAGDLSWVQATAINGAFGTGGSPTSLNALTRLASGSFVAVGTGPAAANAGPGGHPLAWTSATGAAWTLAGGLDRSPSLLDETPRGVCSGPDGAVAVGVGALAGPGSRALAWTSRSGSAWTAASVPAAVTGGADSIAGCSPTAVTAASTPATAPSSTAPSTAASTTAVSTSAPASTGTSGGLVAWGSTTSADGTLHPTLWRSPTGATWTVQKVTAFSDAPAIGLRSLAISGQSWLAAGGSASATTDTAAGAGLGLWTSSNSGATWSRVDTGATPWQTTGTASLDQVAWLGATAVVAGTVNGQLAVWESTAPAG
ncbi:hypothetical protein K6U06_07115 [Acidiferrimicrobium sp. IK]|uniref:hypothetical protein n=1 Tax=Acidiferrimicrobium sp. IK TaxID=2871700 RepID=UPI0021CAF8F6|nr:hypothetical protein [Acidiferrimicrobium sp. IK]MCU4184124.1 hypothetical protein [Acidiferrimicrobium sp. IK]